MQFDPSNDDQHDFPAAPKVSSGPGGTFNADHPYDGDPLSAPRDDWGHGAFPPSSPYAGKSGGTPPEPILTTGMTPSEEFFRRNEGDSGASLYPLDPRAARPARTSPQRRRAIALISLLLLFVVVVGSVGFILLNSHGATGKQSPNTGPVAVATDAATPTFTPLPTETLAPGQTPLPTRIPATDVPSGGNGGGVPGQPTSTPIPYANSATVTITRATQAAHASAPTVQVSTGAGGGLGVVHVPSTSDNGTDTGATIYHDGLPFPFLITVYNPSSTNTIGSFAGTPIPGSNGVSCTIQSDGGLTPKQTLTQTCIEPEAHNPASDYSWTNPVNGLQYTGHANAGGTPPYGVVPDNCGDMTTATNNAKKALQNDLNSKMGGSTFFSASPIGLSNAGCTPSAGSQTAANATYQKTITATGEQSGYSPGGVVSYQHGQVGADQNWSVTAIADCAPSVQSVASLDSATIACQATGTETYTAAYDKNAMANLIHGEDVGTATAQLKAVQGVGNASITLSGGSLLPNAANKITINP